MIFFCMIRTAEFNRDTESLLDIKHGNCRFWIAPVTLIRDEVYKGNSCLRFAYQLSFCEWEAAVVITSEADYAQRFVSINWDVNHFLKLCAVFSLRLGHSERFSE